MTKVLSFHPTGKLFCAFALVRKADFVRVSPPPDAIAAQPQSIWHKYVRTAEKWDRRMMDKWKTNMNNLLIFVGSP